MKLRILIAAVALSGCMTAQQGALQGVEYTCASATAALKTVILLNDKLTAANRANVTKAVAVVNPICSQQNPPTLDSTARAALDSALAQLAAASAQVTQ